MQKSNLTVYVLVQQDTCGSDSEWKVHGVFSSEKEATIAGLKLLVEEALLPWKHTRMPWNDFNDFCSCLSDYHVEEWAVDGPSKSVTHIGYQIIPYKSHLDTILKDIKKQNSKETVVSTLEQWRREILRGDIPEELNNCIHTHRYSEKGSSLDNIK